MAGGASDEDDGLIAGINVTPLVDITLVLLIIFMVTARIIVSQGMPMDLPKSASGEALQTVFAVELTDPASPSAPRSCGCSRKGWKSAPSPRFGPGSTRQERSSHSFRRRRLPATSRRGQ